MEKSESIKNLAMALVKFHSQMGKVKKDSSNPFFKSKYAALPDILSAINDPLVNCGLAIAQFPFGTTGLTTILMHESGEYLMETSQMTPSKNDPQGIGSCITYQRRYAVGAILSLNIDEDDDGNKASGKIQEPTEQQKVNGMLKKNGSTDEQIKKAIAGCNSIPELTAIWNNNPSIHHSGEFTNLFTERKLQLQK